MLFKGPMVRAILTGEKTQTRRIAKTARQPVQVGDRIWVKETHIPKASGTIYHADYDQVEAAGLGGLYGGWKPSIFCRREYSRIDLEVTEVRRQRLQEITREDAKAEGVKQWLEDQGRRLQISRGTDGGGAFLKYREAFRELWDSINAAPKPKMGPRAADGSKVIASYESYPWETAHFLGYSFREGRVHRGKSHIIKVNPEVWAITFRRIE